MQPLWSVGGVILVGVAACSPNPVRRLAPVPADSAGLACASRALDRAGYDVRASKRVPNQLEAERREGAPTTEVRREIITVTYLPGASPPELRAAAQAIALHPALARSWPNEALPQAAVAAVPEEATVAAAQQVLAECGRH